MKRGDNNIKKVNNKKVRINLKMNTIKNITPSSSNSSVSDRDDRGVNNNNGYENTYIDYIFGDNLIYYYELKKRENKTISRKEVEEIYINNINLINRYNLSTNDILKYNFLNILKELENEYLYNETLLLNDYMSSDNAVYVNIDNKLKYITTLYEVKSRRANFNTYKILILKNNIYMTGVGEIIKDFINNRYKNIQYDGFVDTEFNIDDLVVSVGVRVDFYDTEDVVYANEIRIISKRSDGVVYNKAYNTGEETVYNIIDRILKIKTEQLVEFIKVSGDIVARKEPNFEEIYIQILDKNFNINNTIDKRKGFNGTGGGGGIIVSKSRIFKSVSYNNDKAKENNCLIHILNYFKRKLLGVKTLDKRFRVKYVRKYINVEEGEPIYFNVSNKLEELYEFNIVIYHDDIINKKIETENEVFNTFEYIFNKSEMKYKETINILLQYNQLTKKGHYSHILEFKKYNVCKTCGEVVFEKQGIHGKRECLEICVKEGFITKKDEKKIDNIWKYEEYKEKLKCNEEKVKDERPTRFLFFDIETFNNKMDNIIDKQKINIYSNTYLTCKSEDDEIEFKFETGNNVMKKFTDFVLSSKYKYIIITYNGSCFDLYPLLEELVKRKVNIRSDELLIANSKILNLEFKGCRVWDLCQFLKCSLNDACRNFKTVNKKKKGFDHKLVQKLYDVIGEENFFKWIRFNDYMREQRKDFFDGIKNNFNINNKQFDEFLTFTYEKLEEYNKGDVLATRELFFKFRKEFLTLTQGLFNDTGYDVLEFYTLAHLSYEIFLDSVGQVRKPKKEDKEPQPIFFTSNENMYNIFKETQYGGRCICDKTQIVNKNMVMLDCCSLYPFIMDTQLYPYKCEPIFTKQFIQPKYDIEERELNNTGFYYCRFNQRNLKLNIIPYRDNKNLYEKRIKDINSIFEDYFNNKYDDNVNKLVEELINTDFDTLYVDNSLDWTYKEEIKCFLNTVDIFHLRKYNVDVEIIPYEHINNTNNFVGLFFPCENMPIFKKFIKPFKEGKINQDNWKNINHPLHKLYNPVNRTVYKLIPNGLSGRLGMNNYNNKNIITDNLDDVINFTKIHSYCDVSQVSNSNSYIVKGECLKINKYKPNYLLSLVYSYSRKYMYDKAYMPIIKAGGEILYGDTDSIIFKRKYLYVIEESGLIGNDFGCFKPELSGSIIRNPNDTTIYPEGIIKNGLVKDCIIQKGIFNQTKSYALYDSKPFDSGKFDDDDKPIFTNYKLTFAGVKPNDYFFMLKNNETITNLKKTKLNDVIELKYDYKLFKLLVKRKNIYTITQNIRKNIFNKLKDNTVEVGVLYSQRIIKKL